MSNDTEVYRSRWADCECGTVTIIENQDSPDGVPDDSDWESFGQCLVCGGSLLAWSADQRVQSDIYWDAGVRAARSSIASYLTSHEFLERVTERCGGGSSSEEVLLAAAAILEERTGTRAVD